MADKAQRAVAVVGVGAVLPDAPNAAAFWRQPDDGPLQHQRGHRRPLGSRRCTTTPTRRRPTRRTRRSAAGSASATGHRSSGDCRSRRRSPTRWTGPRSGRSSPRREALIDYGYPDRPLDPDRTAVILGNAMAGDMHYLTALRAFFPEYADELTDAPTFAALPDATCAGRPRRAPRRASRDRFPDITEDTMPGELANIIAGRVANLFNFHGPNFIVDAACASAHGRHRRRHRGARSRATTTPCSPAASTRNMGASSFVKFCKIGALSATGTRPYDDGADGFVMGEGAAVFLLKRLADAERDGDQIYAVIRGVGGSSDGKGKGITAPNPVGQKLAIERGLGERRPRPRPRHLIEGHGTSTRVGDVVEVESLSTVFGELGLAPGSMPLGSVKSNIGHLKGAAGAAGMLKAVAGARREGAAPDARRHRAQPEHRLRRLAVLRQHRARRLERAGRTPCAAPASAPSASAAPTSTSCSRSTSPAGSAAIDGRTVRRSTRRQPAQASAAVDLKAPLRGALVVGAPPTPSVLARLETVREAAAAGEAPPPAPPAEADLRAPVRIAIDYGDAAELADKTGKAHKALESGNAGGMEGAAQPGHLPRPRRGPPGRLPLHRPGLAVRQHARARCARPSRSSPRSSTRPTGSWTPHPRASR